MLCTWINSDNFSIKLSVDHLFFPSYAFWSPVIYYYNNLFSWHTKRNNIIALLWPKQKEIKTLACQYIAVLRPQKVTYMDFITHQWKEDCQIKIPFSTEEKWVDFAEMLCSYTRMCWVVWIAKIILTGITYWFQYNLLLQYCFCLAQQWTFEYLCIK